MFTRFKKTAVSISNSIYKSNLSTCIVDMENVEPFIFGDAFLNFVWFETFAQTPFFDFRHFQRIFTAGQDHFTNNIINSIDGPIAHIRAINGPLKFPGQLPKLRTL